MGRSKRFELQGRSRGRKVPLLLVITTAITITTNSPSSLAADEEGSCAPVVGRVVSLQGKVEAQRARSQAWIPVPRLDTPLCEGDRLRTGRASRAAIFIQPENLIRIDQNTELTVSQSKEETFIEFFQELTARAADAAAQGCGAGYFITRFPKNFRIRTPHVNAAVEGTEFLVAMRCETTELAVFEGKVRAQTIASSQEQTLTSGQVLAAGSTEPAAIKLLVKPTDAVQWALYYPPLSDASVAAQFPSSSDCLHLPDTLRPVCYSQRTEQLLRVGRVDEAETEINQALAQTPTDGNIFAIRSVISLVKNDREGALSAAQKAVEISPKSSRAWIALSYAQQAHFKLEDSLKSIQRAAEISTDSSLVQARLAELYMSLGRTRDAEKAARRAVKANPNEERPYTVLGFVHLAHINVKAAQVDFRNALERDSTAPLPRLGLGLAIIRQGQLIPGREQLEIAVALDPSNSLLRSYVGKGYYEENTKERDKLAATQFDLAKQLDSNDPTPWFYNAILRDSKNRPIDAIQELQQSISLNDNRGVYRSRLLLDQDLASRATEVGRISDSLGFSRTSVIEGWNSLLLDPANYSAHRLLSDAYGHLPQHDIARVSELLQSQLLQPLGLNPVQPLLAESNLTISATTTSLDPSFNEFSSLFMRDRLRLVASGLTASNDTDAHDIILFGTKDRISAAAAQSQYDTAGFRPNADYREGIYSLFSQVALTGTDSLQGEYRWKKLDHGDISLRYSPDNFFANDRRHLENTTSRIGYHSALSSRSDVVVSWIHVDNSERQHVERVLDPSIPLTFIIDGVREDSGSTSEIQYQYRSGTVNVIIGAGYVATDGTLTDTTQLAPFFPPDPPTISDVGVRQRSAYGYLYWNPSATWHWTFGLGTADYKSADLDKSQINPKIGLIWQPVESTSFRAAAFRSLKRELVTDQTIEPTGVAGFNQFFDDFNATDSTRIGAAIDQKLGSAGRAGLEVSRRRLFGPIDDITQEEEQREVLNSAYWHLPIGRSTALSTQVLYQRFDRDRLPADTTNPKKLSTLTIPVMATWFANQNLFFKLAATYVRQDVEYVDTSATGVVTVSDPFWLFDTQAGFRLPRRIGVLTLGVNNFTNDKFNYQDLNYRSSSPRLPAFVPERTFFLKGTLSF
jgi:tetratricopeptide (TPR) repeat protein